MSEYSQADLDKKYNEWARRNPAIISIVFPLLVAVYFFQEYTEELSNIRYLVGVVLSFGSIVPALIFFYQFALREVSIWCIEEPLYLLLGRPAVNIMRKNNCTISRTRKERILEIARNEGIDAIFVDEKVPKSRRERRQKAREAFELIREDCRDNSIAFEYNCIYGFFRNLSGGILFDFVLFKLISRLDIFVRVIKKYDASFVVSCCSIALLILLVVCVFCTYSSAIKYAKRVYVLYLKTHQIKS